MKRTDIWHLLFDRALAIIDEAVTAGMPANDWSFGGGTVLMRKYQHRFSRDIDIFLPEPQYLGFLTPRLNGIAETGMVDYVEQHGAVKIYFPEGEVDFVAANPLTATPIEIQIIADRQVRVETPTEIVGKKIYYRARDFKARDLFDLALVLDRVPESRAELGELLKAQRQHLVDRLRTRDAVLREDFAQIDTLEFNPSYDECVEQLRPYIE